MQVTVEKPSNLERKIVVEIPEDDINSQVTSRLKDLTKKVKVDGFRPGKIPFSVMKQRFGAQVREEVVNEVLRQSYADALTEQELRPAGEPVIDPIESKRGEGLKYTAAFEVFPEVSLGPIEELTIERASCEISDADVDQMVETLRKQHKTFTEVERASQEGDQITIDFVGRIDGETFQGGEAEGFELELGAGLMIDGFEEGLTGKSAGDEVTLSLRFPEKYQNAELAGKAVEFEVKVQKIAESALPELDAEFFKNFGVEEGGEEAFRKEIRENMDRERERALKQKLSRDALDQLHDSNTLDLPKSLVESEVQRMRQQTVQNMMQRGIDPSQLGLDDNEALTEAASKRVKLGLLMAEMVKEAEIKPDPAKVRETIEGMAASYEDPAAVMKWYYDDPQRLQEIEAMCLEEEAVNWMVERAQTKDVQISFDDLMNPGQTDE
ncbi:MAG: trigger factor [Gammaproteobacteria bacterium]